MAAPLPRLDCAAFARIAGESPMRFYEDDCRAEDEAGRFSGEHCCSRLNRAAPKRYRRHNRNLAYLVELFVACFSVFGIWSGQFNLCSSSYATRIDRLALPGSSGLSLRIRNATAGARSVSRRTIVLLRHRQPSPAAGTDASCAARCGRYSGMSCLSP